MIDDIDDEKQARYNVLKLMLAEKFREAESLLNSYVRLRVMDKSYSDFYYRILEAIHVPHNQRAGLSANLIEALPRYQTIR